MKTKSLDRVAEVESEQPERLPVFELRPVRSIAVWSPAGAGKSTVAVNLADQLGRLGKRVLLVDADLTSPSCSLMLGLGPDATGISSVCRLAREARLDRGELLRLAIRMEASRGAFHLLPGITSNIRWPEVTPSAIEVLLRVASQDFDIVIFDLASSLEPALRAAAAAIARNELTRYLVTNCEAAVLLAAADPVGLQRFVRQYLEVAQLRGQLSSIIAINRVRATSIGADPQRQIEKVMAQLLKVRPQRFLPDDPHRVDAALREGIPVRLVSRRGAFAKAVAELAADLVQ